MQRRGILICALLLCGAGRAHAQHGFWQPDERVLITSFLDARAIATDQQHVYVATDNGLEIYDATFRRWLPPSTIEDGYPGQPLALAYDARERGVWLVTAMQVPFVWSLVSGRWEQRFMSDVPPDVREQLARSPRLDGTVSMSLRPDALGRRFQISDIVPAERRDTYWAAFLGDNFGFIDTRVLNTERYAFGTLARTVTALALDDDGRIYFGELGYGRHGITRADSALQQWTQFDARGAELPQAPIHQLLATPTGVYAAAEDGLFVLREERWRRILDADARALARAHGRIWVGTQGRLGWLDANDEFQRSDLPLQTVYGLAARQDTLWIAAEQGLLTLTPQASAMQLARSAYAVAASDDAVVAILDNGVHMWNGRTWDGPLRHASVQIIGRPVAVRAADEFIWIGGERGVAEWNGRTQSWRHLQVPADIPEGPVYDVVKENGRLWLATPAGALRVLWR